MQKPLQMMSSRLHDIQRMEPRARAEMAAELVEQLSTLSRRAVAIRDNAIAELVECQEFSYSRAAAKGGVSKSLAAKVRTRGRGGTEVKRLAKFIPKHPLEQSLWKDQVCLWYAHGEPLSVAMDLATETVRQDYPSFQPRYESEILDL